MPRPLITALLVWMVGCAARTVENVGYLEVDRHRVRISKVRHAIAETRSVLAGTAGDAQQPELYLRLAELTSEEAKFHYLVALERQKGRAEALHLPQVRLLKQQSIGLYQSLLSKWPDAQIADQAMFAISQEHRDLGQIEEMTQTLEALLERFPTSRFRAEALLLLGNHHYENARFEPAKVRFQQLLGLKDPRLTGMAHYKLAWVSVNQGACRDAVRSFERALRAEREREGTGAPPEKRRWTDDDGSFAIPVRAQPLGETGAADTLDVAQQSLVDVTYCYAQVGEPKQAVPYLRKWAPSRAAYVAALVKMAQRYATVEQPLGAANVARELLRYGPDAPDRIDDGRLLHGALTRTSDYAHVGDDVRLMLTVSGRRRMAPEVTPEQREQLGREFEGLTRDLLLRAHRMVQDRGRSEWTDRPTNRQQTIDGYLAWLRTFPQANEIGDLHANVAELLLDARRPLEAASHFEQAAVAYTREERPNDARDAQYQAAFGYQQALERVADAPRVHTVQARAGLRRVGGAWLATAPKGAPARAMAFSIARSYYDEGDHLAAVDLLTAVAWTYPRQEEGQAAALLVLDSYNSLNDLTGLLRAGQRFASADSPLPRASQTRIAAILDSAEQRQLDELALAASGDEAGGLETLMDFVQAYDGSDLAERALLSAFVAAQAQGDAATMFKVGSTVLDKYPNGEQTPGVASALGQVAAARYDFDEARKWLDMAGHKATDNAQARAIFLSLAEFELRLSNPTAAMSACRSALTRSPQPAERADVYRMLTRVVEQSVDPQGVIGALRPYRSRDPEVNSLLGLALIRSGQRDDGEMALTAVASDPSASARAVARAQLGLAEANLGYLREFRATADLDAIDELVGLIELTVQGFLTAARQPEPDLSLVALGRLAKATQVAADKLEAAGVPSDLPAPDRKVLAQALTQRVAGLRSGHTEALAECANRARASWTVNAAGRACLAGTLPDDLPLDPANRTPRRPATVAADEVRNRLASNPKDLEALRTLGDAYIEAGDGHAARMVFQAAVEESGDNEDLVRLAEAHRLTGDRVAEAQTLGRAHAAGHPAATEALATVLTDLGLADEAARLREEESRG